MSELALYPVALFFTLSACHFAGRREGASGAAARCTCCASVLLGAALLLLAPPTVRGARELGAPAPLVLVALGDALRDGAAASLGLLARSLRTPGPVRGLVRGSVRGSGGVRAAVGVLAGVVAVRGVLLAVAAPDLAGGRMAVGPGWEGRWALAGYTAVGTLYLGWCLGALRRRVAERARAASGAARAGLRLVGWGVAAGLVWDAWGVDDVVRALAYGSVDGAEDAVCAVLGLVCSALVAAGLGWALWPAARAAATGWLRAQAHYRALAPLWRDLHAALPQIALGPARRLAPVPLDVRYALYRRVIEIQDARLVLRHHLDPRAEAWLAAALGRFPVPAACAGASAQAAALAAALERAASGARPGVCAPPGPPPGGQGAQGPGALDAEAAGLARLARAYATCPAVAAVRTRARAAREHP
ncbi:MAB_1171c family putative transporter [Kitasatospora sp. NPDC101183]|uniref:MAB_1171c family putative transporter n=1 Tax=Kitasatospora sp. NPDC101183 TaxID=3364100 RepID=UPI00382BBC6B